MRRLLEKNLKGVMTTRIIQCSGCGCDIDRTGDPTRDLNHLYCRDCVRATARRISGNDELHWLLTLCDEE